MIQFSSRNELKDGNNRLLGF
uniref:Uncharacterized protein n=1 Tax=Anguilla anguilla TaxID=7936 RepID=A0A0E9R3G9_ANGAN